MCVELGPLGKTLVEVKTGSHDLTPGSCGVDHGTGEVRKATAMRGGIRGMIRGVHYGMEARGDGVFFGRIGRKVVVFEFDIWITYRTVFQVIPDISPI